MGASPRSPMARSIARAVRGASGMVTTLPALAGDGQGPVAAFGAQGLDTGAGGFGDPQPVQGEQRDQSMLWRRPKTELGEMLVAELVAVQPGGVLLVVQPGPRT
jgi:hypothetical protein